MTAEGSEPGMLRGTHSRTHVPPIGPITGGLLARLMFRYCSLLRQGDGRCRAARFEGAALAAIGGVVLIVNNG